MAMWWEAGTPTPQALKYARRLYKAGWDLVRKEVYGASRPRNPKEAQAAVKRYVAKESKRPDPSDIFGENRGHIQYATIAGALGLLKPPGTPVEVLQKAMPEARKMSPDLRLLASPEGAERILAQSSQALGLLTYVMAPYDTAASYLDALEKADLDALAEARIYLRRLAAFLLKTTAMRQQWRRLRQTLNIWVPQMKSARKSRRTLAVQDLVLTREGFLVTVLALLFHTIALIVEDGDIGAGLRRINQGDQEILSDLLRAFGSGST